MQFILIIIVLSLFFSFLRLIDDPNRLFNFFLIAVFICNIIPDGSGIRLTNSSPLINSQKLFSVLLLGALLFTKFKKRSQFDKSIYILLVILISSRFVSAFNSSNLYTSILYWLNAVLTIYLYYFAIVILIDSEIKMNRVIKVLFFTGILVALSNYFEFITAINLAHIFPNVSNELDFWIYEKVSGVNRVFGLKADPVVTSYYLTFVFPLGLYLYHYEKKKKWLFYTILIVIASILNFTRASMVSIIVMVFIYLFVVSSNRKVKIIFSIALLILIFTIDNPVKQLFIDTLTTFTSNTTSGFDYTRTLGLFDALPSMIDKIPFWGIGTGSLGRPDLIIDYYNKIGFLYSSASVRTELPFIITTLLDGGYIESLSFLFLLLVVITKSLSLVFGSINRKKEIGSYLLMIFIGYFICLTFNGIFDIFSIIYLMIGILNMQLILKKIQHDNTILKCL